MNVKRRHIRMARAAFRVRKSQHPVNERALWAIYLWHRAANGRKA